MEDHSRSCLVKLEHWLVGLVGLALVLLPGPIVRADEETQPGGTGLIAGVVSKMVSPSGATEVVGGASVSVEREVSSEEDTEAKFEAVPSLSVKTDENGCYVIKEVPQGQYRLTVTGEGLSPGTEWASVEDWHSVALDFVLEKKHKPGVGTVQGTITAGEGSETAGQPLAGATVEVRRPYPFQGATFSTLTDGDGRYSLNVPTGFQQVSVSGEGFALDLRAVEVEEDTVIQVDFALPIATEEPEGAG